MVKTADDVVISATNFVSERLCPIFQVNLFSFKAGHWSSGIDWKTKFSGKICHFWLSINLSWDRMSCLKNWARSAQPFWRVLDTKRQTNKSNLKVDVMDGKMFLGKRERNDLIIINRGVVRNLSRVGLKFFYFQWGVSTRLGLKIPWNPSILASLY